MKNDYISREEAYAFFKDQLEKETGAYSKGRNSGLRVAMSAIMNKEAIPAADVVSRDAFNRILAENDTMRAQLAQIGKKPGDSMDDVRRVKSGKWKEWWPGDCSLIMTGEEMLWMCSECDAKFTEQSSFCPNCGADMREADNEI